MRIYITIYLLLFCLATSLAQKEDFVWMLGSGNAFDPLYTTSIIDFNHYPPKMDIYFQDFDFDFVASIVSDKEGQLLCYSNGVDIKNKAHDIIENGGELLDYMFYPSGLTLPQATLMLPIPEQDGKYFYLTTQYFRFQYQGVWGGGASPLWKSTIDMNANNGEGLITERNTVFNTDTLSPGQIVATRHANGRDWWILASRFRTNQFYRYLLTPQGLTEQSLQQVGTPLQDDLGQAAFSPDGRYYARYNEDGLAKQVVLDLYDFDRCTGLLSNHRQDSIDIHVPGGVAFSPNSRYLYISLWEEIWQYDLQAPNVFDSGVLVAEYDGFLGDNQGFMYHNRFFMMQLAPDGRIYINIPNINSQYLHVIQYPDQPGLACEVRQHSIKLPAFNAFTLPNLPWYRLGPEAGSECDSLGISKAPLAHFRFDPDPNDSLHIRFTDLSAYEPSSWRWDFGDVTGQSNSKDPDYRYLDNGIYEVCLEVSNAYGTDRSCQTLNLGNVVSTNTPVIATTINIYPNPFAQQLSIHWPAFNPGATINILDPLGRIIHSEVLSSENQQINTQNWPMGIYFYEILQSGSVQVSGKLLKR